MISHRGPQLLGYPRKTLCSAVMAIKLICGSFLVVLLLSCLADTRSIAPNDPYNPGGGGQSKTRFDPEFRTCEVARENRISCGEAGLTQNQCENLECCYDSGACYFGKVGEYNNRASSLRSFLCLMRSVSYWHLFCDFYSP